MAGITLFLLLSNEKFLFYILFLTRFFNEILGADWGGEKPTPVRGEGGGQMYGPVGFQGMGAGYAKTSLTAPLPCLLAFSFSLTHWFSFSRSLAHLFSLHNRLEWRQRWWRLSLCCQAISVSRKFKCMRNILKAKPEAGTGNILSRLFKLRITRITLPMNPIMSILSHLLLCTPAREFAILQALRHLTMILGLIFGMQILKFSRSSDRFLMSMFKDTSL